MSTKKEKPKVGTNHEQIQAAWDAPFPLVGGSYRHHVGKLIREDNQPAEADEKDAGDEAAPKRGKK